uniref:LOW QUALITY PROTEIN: serine/threonine-protein kinase LMTK1-like n=1 Tax=Oncorhynchus gorbuscha TaxID=8017 RepID=UPI001EAF6B68|nr:LOW QUALITY PROTEIN: serine/threonine-protein kinase LMTK1-like [Oncorhynchus gorbuscha]
MLPGPPELEHRCCLGPQSESTEAFLAPRVRTQRLPGPPELEHRGFLGPQSSLGEVNAGLSTTQVVVKELKASASVQDQMHFLEEAQPYRALQNPALLQCLAQCSEVTPYLLVMEFCPLGDLKSYLRSCRAADSVTPDPLTLQRMACEIASGLLHLHKHNFIHSDLALRNCLLTSERTVKIGDYGLSHSRYKDDYFVTPDQIWVPLRWIAPELIDEVHGNLLVVDQTKDSNVWSLGVTIWELFELGNQPYRHYTDRQVLTYAVKEQQLKLTRPRLKVPLAERWYEVMQFCWLQPEQRPNSEEVHLLLTYLCAKGASGVQEDFEQRWNSLRPNLTGSTTHSHTAPAPPPLAQTTVPAPARPSISGDVELEPASTSRNSFPLLEHFSHDSFHSDSGDDILTVTETSYGGLNFEYKWEQARAEQPYCSSSTSGPLGQGNPHYQDVYYPVGNTATSGSCKGDGVDGGLVLGVSPSYYESDHSGSGSGSGVGVVPVLSAHSPSVGSEYYIRIEEPVECNINLDDSVVDYSPGLEAEDGLSSGSRTPQPQSQSQPSAYWSAAAGDSSGGKHSTHDSDNSPALSLTMEPLLRQTASTASPVELGRSHQYFSPNQRQAFYCEQSPIRETCCQSPEDTPIMSQLNLHHPMGRLETLWGTRWEPRPVDTLDMLSLSLSVTNASPCEAFSLDDVFLHPSSSLSSSFTSSSFTSSSLLPKSLDSGYDTENNESPEFILKEGGGNGDFLLDCEGNQQQHPVLGGSHLARGGVSLGPRSDQMVLQQVDLGDGVGVTLCTSSSSGCTELQLKGLSDKNLFVTLPTSLTTTQRTRGVPRMKGVTSSPVQEIRRTFGAHSLETEDTVDGGLSGQRVHPCDAVGLESEHSGEEPASGCSSTMVSEGSSTVQEASARHPDQENHHRASEDDYSPIQSLGSDSTIDYREEVLKEEEDGEGEQGSTEEDMPEFNQELCREVERRAPLTEGEESDDSESEEELRSYNLQEELSEEDILLCDELDRKKKAVSFFDDVTVFLFDRRTGELADFTFPQEQSPAARPQAGRTPSRTSIPTPPWFTTTSPPWATTSTPAEHHTLPEDSDGNMSEEGGGFEWEDDIPLMTSPLSSPSTAEPPVSDLIPVPAAKPPEDKPPEDKPPEDKPPEDKPPEDKPPEDKPPEDKPPEDKPPEDKPPEDKPVAVTAASQFSRFSVSRSRFSITHVPNPDLNSGGQSW